MGINSDFEKYHLSITAELKASKDRIRHLIGSAHWPSDGAYKEIILRKVLRRLLPASLELGTGFMCMPDSKSSQVDRSDTLKSSQIDILVTHSNKPCLFREDELLFVTPHAVAGIIEVKTAIRSKAELEEALSKLSKQTAMARTKGDSQPIWSGLFVYNQAGKLTPETVLEAFQNNNAADRDGVINALALGPKLFVRFWEDGIDIQLSSGAMWVAYNFNQPQKALAHTYFISNAVVKMSHNVSPSAEEAWFPFKSGKGPYYAGHIKYSPVKKQASD